MPEHKGHCAGCNEMEIFGSEHEEEEIDRIEHLTTKPYDFLEQIVMLNMADVILHPKLYNFLVNRDLEFSFFTNPFECYDVTKIKKINNFPQRSISCLSCFAIRIPLIKG